MRPGAELAIQSAIEALEVTRHCPGGGPRAGQQSPNDDPYCGRDPKSLSDEEKIIVKDPDSQVRYCMLHLRKDPKDWIVKKSGTAAKRVYLLKNQWVLTLTRLESGEYTGSVVRPPKKSE